MTREEYKEQFNKFLATLGESHLDNITDASAKFVEKVSNQFYFSTQQTIDFLNMLTEYTMEILTSANDSIDMANREMMRLANAFRIENGRKPLK